MISKELKQQINRGLKKDEIVQMLALENFSPIYEAADEIRRQSVGDTVHLRAIIEFSNICKRQCVYCGLNRDNKELPRFRMTQEEIIETAREAVKVGYRTIVLQSGEDDWFTTERLGDIVKEIKAMKLPCASKDDPGTLYTVSPAVTLSCGEMSREAYEFLKKCGADRYLLKHETADPETYSRLHPCGTLENRTNCLKAIYESNYETGSGFMVGLPGQTLETIAEDLLLLKELNCKMAGIGPFIANPKTQLAGEKNGDPELTRRAVALARLLIPTANLPITTALSVLSADEKTGAGEDEGGCRSAERSANGAAAEESGAAGTAYADANPFAFGANVVMKKVTPDEYKAAYEIYPAEFKPTDIAGDRKELEEIIRSYGRTPL